MFGDGDPRKKWEEAEQELARELPPWMREGTGVRKK